MNSHSINITPSPTTIKEYVDSIRMGQKSKAGELYRSFRVSFFSGGLSQFQIDEENMASIYQQAVLIFYRNIANGAEIDFTRTPLDYLESVGIYLIMNNFPNTKLSNAFLSGKVSIAHFDLEQNYGISEQKKALRKKIISVGDKPNRILRGFYYRKHINEAIQHNSAFATTESAEIAKQRSLSLLGIKLSPAEIILVQKYFSKELSEQEESSFKQKIAESSLFRANFEQYRLLLQIIDELEETEIKHSLLLEEEVFYSKEERERDELQEIVQKGRFKRIASVKNISIVAGALILVFSIWFLLRQPSSYNLVIFEKHFELPKWETDFGNSEIGVLNKLKKAKQMYLASDFESSIRNINSFLLAENNRSKYYSEAHFYKGMSLIALEREKEGISELNLLGSQQDSVFQSQLNWYLALAHLKLNQKKETKYYLKKTMQQNQDKTLQKRARGIFELIK